MTDDKTDHKLEAALGLIKDGLYDVKEAEALFKIKVPLKRLGEIYDSETHGFYIEGKQGSSPDYYGWAKYFVGKNKYFSFDGGHYIYDHTLHHYRKISETEIDWLLTKDTNEKVRPNHRNHFLRTLYAYEFKVPSKMRPPHGYLNLKNGILDVEKRSILPHDDSIFFTYCLPHEYKPDAQCPNWMKFLSEVFEGNTEMTAVAAQIFGYILLSGNPWMHQAFVLYGEGRNGKSTFLDILKALLGRDNFTSVSLARHNQPFSAVQLEGKMANILEETPNEKINAELFKTAIGGGDVWAAEKFKNEYQFTCIARFIFACNEMPKFSENSVGLLERLYFIPFTTYFSKTVRKARIGRELVKELPGILNWALSGMETIIEEQYLPECAASKELMEQYRLESDSVYGWAKDAIVFTPDSKIEMQAKHLYTYYKNSLDGTGRHPVSDMTFYKRIKKYLKSLPGYSE